MESDPNQRSREIGAALRRARHRADKTQEDCAERIGTTRKRYGAIESGASYISVVELERLMLYLDVAPHEVLLREVLERASDRRRIIVDATAQPGEVLEVLLSFDIAPRGKPEEP